MVSSTCFRFSLSNESEWSLTRFNKQCSISVYWQATRGRIKRKKARCLKARQIRSEQHSTKWNSSFIKSASNALLVWRTRTHFSPLKKNRASSKDGVQQFDTVYSTNIKLSNISCQTLPGCLLRVSPGLLVPFLKWQMNWPFQLFTPAGARAAGMWKGLKNAIYEIQSLWGSPILPPIKNNEIRFLVRDGSTLAVLSVRGWFNSTPRGKSHPSHCSVTQKLICIVIKSLDMDPATVWNQHLFWFV